MLVLVSGVRRSDQCDLKRDLCECGLRRVLRLCCRWRGLRPRAQDTRQVTEPKIPAACVQVGCAAYAVGDKLTEADEHEAGYGADPVALDKCKPGMAVELTDHGNGSNAFLSGPLELRDGCDAAGG